MFLLANQQYSNVSIHLQDAFHLWFSFFFRDLRFNKIRELQADSFKGHRNLASLLLNNNLLTSLKDGTFEGLFHLQHLYLYKNRIKYIEPNVFQGLKKLERL